MKKELYIFVEGKPTKAVIRSYTENDFEALIAIQSESFPPPFPAELWWSEEQLLEHIKRFSSGALCAEVDGRLIGSTTSLVVDMNDYGHAHNWETITDHGYIRNHDEHGDTLYVVDICVIPAYRKTGIGKWLMQSLYEVVVQQRLKRLLGGGRMPGYASYADSNPNATPEQYLKLVMQGEIIDPVITFLLRCGRTPVAVADHYLEDAQSRDHAVIMEWRNPFIGEC